MAYFKFWFQLNIITVITQCYIRNNTVEADLYLMQCFKSSPDKFPVFFRQLMVMSLREEGLSFKEQTILIIFLIHCFNSHVNIVRSPVNRTSLL